MGIPFIADLNVPEMTTLSVIASLIFTTVALYLFPIGSDPYLTSTWHFLITSLVAAGVGAVLVFLFHRRRNSLLIKPDEDKISAFEKVLRSRRPTDVNRPCVVELEDGTKLVGSSIGDCSDGRKVLFGWYTLKLDRDKTQKLSRCQLRRLKRAKRGRGLSRLLTKGLPTQARFLPRKKVEVSIEAVNQIQSLNNDRLDIAGNECLWLNDVKNLEFTLNPNIEGFGRLLNGRVFKPPLEVPEAVPSEVSGTK